jgi:lipoprotein-anchoring transpeptidase ErfK/SrfK
MITNNKIIVVSVIKQQMSYFEQDNLMGVYPISSGKNGVGELIHSECTPRGWHKIYSVIGLDYPINCVFVARKWTSEIYTEQLATQNPDRDWIITRLLQLEGLEQGRNSGGGVDSLKRCIYIHGTPDSTKLDKPNSHGCIRMKNNDIIELALWATLDTLVYIQ